MVPGIARVSFSSTSTATVSHNSNSCSKRNDYQLNKHVTKQTISRHGRSGQKWIVDAQSSQVTRLVTGCVPILKDEKVMLVSSSKKREWILPKGESE